MTVEMIQFLIICPFTFLAGFVDAVAGGGGLISLPAYLIAGLPVHYAISTNKLSSGMGTAISTARFAKKGFIPWKQSTFYIAAALLGSSIGANIALMLDDGIFKMIMLVIIPLTTFYIMKKKNFGTEKELYSYKKTLFIGIIIALTIGIYDGLYGPATGTFLLLLLTSLAHMKLENANGISKVINLTTNLTALFVFAREGKVLFLLGLIAGLFNVAGNYLGVNFFSKGGVKVVKPIMLIVLAIFFVRILSELY